MEGYEGSPASTLAGFKDKKKRTPKLRTPRNTKESLQSFTFMPPSTYVNTTTPDSEQGNSSESKRENKLKLKLKLGGVTRTIQTSKEAKTTVEEQRHVQKTMYLGDINRSESMSLKRRHGLKKRLLDQEPEIDDDDDDDDGDEDEEIRYLEKLKSKRVARDSYGSEEGEGEHLSEKKKHRSGQVPTTRTRALQSGKDPYSPMGLSSLEFPDGLPHLSSRRQKQKLSEVEQQSKKAEAAQRRRVQSAKAAQEAEAEAIRKILGQDSGRKKKEDKIKKQQEERAQERAARSSRLALNTIRLVIGPNGTTMTFSEDIGLPDIFKPITFSYPPPREKCVGPNCEKEYKYRDSKSKLPLCSLGCYKAVQDKIPTTTTSEIHC